MVGFLHVRFEMPFSRDNQIDHATMFDRMALDKQSMAFGEINVFISQIRSLNSFF